MGIAARTAVDDVCTSGGNIWGFGVKNLLCKYGSDNMLWGDELTSTKWKWALGSERQLRCAGPRSLSRGRSRVSRRRSQKQRMAESGRRS